MRRKVSETAIPPSSAPTLNAAALTQLDDPTCREAIARLTLSGPGVATLREARRSESRTAGTSDTSFAFWRLSGIVLESLDERFVHNATAPTSGQRAADAIETDGSPAEAARKSADAH